MFGTAFPRLHHTRLCTCMRLHGPNILSSPGGSSVGDAFNCNLPEHQRRGLDGRDFDWIFATTRSPNSSSLKVCQAFGPSPGEWIVETSRYMIDSGSSPPPSGHLLLVRFTWFFAWLPCYLPMVLPPYLLLLPLKKTRKRTGSDHRGREARPGAAGKLV